MSKEIVNEELKKVVDPEENKLKEIFVKYVGEKLNPEDDKVTVEMIVEDLSEEFPEFLIAVAEENFIRGYKQALTDKEKFDTLRKEAEAMEKNK